MLCLTRPKMGARFTHMIFNNTIVYAVGGMPTKGAKYRGLENATPHKYTATVVKTLTRVSGGGAGLIVSPRSKANRL